VRYGRRAKDVKNLLELYEKSRGEGFGPEVKRRIMIGTYALSSGYYEAYYAKAQKVRTLVKQDFDKAFKEVDVIATPTSPSTAFKIGEKASDPMQMYLSDIFTISCNLAGLPGLSIPCGFSQAKLPIGLQLLGRPFEEGTLLSVAHHYEQAKQWNKEAPKIAV
jgi:aspartyl-tRNA(Asn)/glutamyl-tRNA(Gln) amidotransferase subunit A